MNTTPPAGQSHYHIILLHPTEPRILLLPEQNGWLLPSFQKEEPTHLSEIIDAMQRQLGIDANACYHTPGGQLPAYDGTRGKHLKAGNTWWCNVLAADTLAAFGGVCLIVSPIFFSGEMLS
jgi:hypothetical protein